MRGKLRELRSAARVNSRGKDKTVAMTEFLTNAIAFIVVISILVTVHEYGHYIVGRWTGMKVLRFSVGFGKPIWMRRGKAPDQTEYCIASIPLGGYVRFLDSRDGSIDPADEGRAFDQRPIASRIAVLLAGPAFNFLFAILAYWVLFGGGVTVVRPAVGEVAEDTYAAAAGLEQGQYIVAVGGEDVAAWDDAIGRILETLVSDHAVPITIEDDYGIRSTKTISVPSDKVSAMTEPGVLFDALGFRPGRPPAIVGLHSEDGAAAQAGLLEFDRIVGVDNEPVQNFGDLVDIVSPQPGTRVVIHFVRDGDRRSVSATLGTQDDTGETRGVLGVRRAYDDLGLFSSLSAATVKTWDQTVFVVKMLGRIVTREVSIKNISGPISIAQIAGESAERGWRDFVLILALISLSLGILNLLPIPVLDGGQIVYQLVELVKGSPMSERAQIMGQQVGILALLLLMTFAFYNDIARNLG